jgi:uncharacterized metal-binding protein
MDRWIMPNYSGHMTINFSLVSGATVFALSALNCEQVSVAVVATSFVFATLFLSPDLDIYYSSPTKNWGILRLLWLPYSLFFKHRGISHSLFFSTLTRIIYLSAVVTVAFLIFHFCKIYLIDTNLEEAVVAATVAGGDVVSPLKEFFVSYQEYIGLIIAGIFCADTLHILSDRIFSVFK